MPYAWDANNGTGDWGSGELLRTINALPKQPKRTAAHSRPAPPPLHQRSTGQSGTGTSLRRWGIAPWGKDAIATKTGRIADVAALDGASGSSTATIPALREALGKSRISTATPAPANTGIDGAQG